MESNDAAPGNALTEGGGESQRGGNIAPHPGGDLPEVIVEFIRIEERRLEINEKRNEVALRTLDISDESDKRQFEYHMEILAKDERQDSKRYNLLRTVIISGIVSILVASVFLLYMAFFGAENQSQTAVSILNVIVFIVGGAGIGQLVTHIIRGLWRG